MQSHEQSHSSFGISRETLRCARYYTRVALLQHIYNIEDRAHHVARSTCDVLYSLCSCPMKPRHAKIWDGEHYRRLRNGLEESGWWTTIYSSKASTEYSRPLWEAVCSWVYTVGYECKRVVGSAFHLDIEVACSRMDVPENVVCMFQKMGVP